MKRNINLVMHNMTLHIDLDRPFVVPLASGALLYAQEKNGTLRLYLQTQSAVYEPDENGINEVVSGDWLIGERELKPGQKSIVWRLTPHERVRLESLLYRDIMTAGGDPDVDEWGDYLDPDLYDDD